MSLTAAQEPIWVCDYLWNQAYVHLEGDVRPGCVAGPPVLGNVERERFDAMWNNDAYRVMRQRMVVRDPVVICKGCLNIRKIRDPKHIGAWLQGSSIPNGRELLPVPPLLAAALAPMLPTVAVAGKLATGTPA